MRKINHLTAIAFCISISILQSCNSNNKNATANLKFNLQKGKIYTYDMDMNMQTASQGRSMNSDMNFTYDMQVLNDSSGIKTVQGTYKRIAMKMDMGAMKADIDTDKPSSDTASDMRSNPRAMMGNMFRAMKGRSFTMKVDNEGKVVAITGLKEMIDTMLNSMKLDEQARSTVQATFSAQFNEENMKKTFAQAFNLFPNKPVKVGDTWEKTISFSGAMPVETKTTYKVKDIDKDKVTLDVNTVMDMGQMKGNQTGTMVIDPATGLVKDGTLKMKMENNMMNLNSTTKITGREK